MQAPEGSIRRPPQKMREALRPLTLANAPCPVKTTRGCLLCNPPPPNLPPSGRPDSVVVAQHAAPVKPFGAVRSLQRHRTRGVILRLPDEGSRRTSTYNFRNNV